MTNRIALFLGILVVAFVIVDLRYDWGATLFAARGLNEIVHWLAFWR